MPTGAGKNAGDQKSIGPFHTGGRFSMNASILCHIFVQHVAGHYATGIPICVIHPHLQLRIEHLFAGAHGHADLAQIALVRRPTSSSS